MSSFIEAASKNFLLCKRKNLPNLILYTTGEREKQSKTDEEMLTHRLSYIKHFSTGNLYTEAATLSFLMNIFFFFFYHFFVYFDRKRKVLPSIYPKFQSFKINISVDDEKFTNILPKIEA